MQSGHDVDMYKVEAAWEVWCRQSVMLGQRLCIRHCGFVQRSCLSLDLGEDMTKGLCLWKFSLIRDMLLSSTAPRQYWISLLQSDTMQ